MYYVIHKKVRISSGHYLEGLPPEHPCSAPHGHNYLVEIEISGSELDEVGIFLDFNKLSSLVKGYDHKMLNDLLAFSGKLTDGKVKKLNPTAENFAFILKHEIEDLLKSKAHFGVRVRVWETEDSWAEAR